LNFENVYMIYDNGNDIWIEDGIRLLSKNTEIRCAEEWQELGEDWVKSR
jgi:hypothetical protein